MAKVKFSAKQVEAIAAAMASERPKGVNLHKPEDLAVVAQHSLCCYALADMLGFFSHQPAYDEFLIKCGMTR